MIFFSLLLSLPEFEQSIPWQQLNLEREDNTGAENPTDFFSLSGIFLPAQVSFLCPGSTATWACAQHIWNWYLCLNSGLQLLELKSKFFQPPNSWAKWLYSYWNWLSGFLFPRLWPSNIDIRYKEIAIRTTSSNSWRQLQEKYCWWWHMGSYIIRFSHTLIIMHLLEIAGNSIFHFLNYSQENISVPFCISSFSLG